MTPAETATAIVSDLMTAILAVNTFSVEQAFAVVKRFPEVGLQDPKRVAKLEADDIVSRLRQAGHERGEFLNRLMALRILSAATALTSGGLKALQDAEAVNDQRQIRVFLLSIHGIGPRVFQNFAVLRGYEPVQPPTAI